tara:strand:+ start:3036 stop:3398 length:363 start_codon:yes stop_codon:yes gene_type:complete
MKINLKYIIIDPVEGIFLGTAKNEDLNFMEVDPSDKRLVALFSNNNILDITKAITFHNKEDAYRYLYMYIQRKYPDAFVGPIEDESDTAYVDTIAIVKAGYGEYAWDMIDALPMQSELVH